ncbi:uncharacterized protein E5676_scaffold237G001340 [Cucumis melo var. makuwa]|uniref:Reverse transcriptase RNase H-like domain-containing protein n=1 Tax=Cucumis melo var. makuwa TaxID=1194695 RepID=A0A5D3DAF2_CUCMM|nr:uncharacterized protein E5676_scaffold237G001340 [Cucumis melo var. makuwa]
MEEESIPLRSLKEEGLSKDLSRFNVDDLLSLPQETKTILIDALLNSRASSSSAPIVTYESTPYCMSIDYSNEDLLLGSKLHNRPLRKKGKLLFVESLKGLKVGDIEVLKESFTIPLTKITKQEIKIDLMEANLPQRQKKDGFNPKAYKLMAKASYDFTTHTKFKSLKIHEQHEPSSTQKKLLREGHAIPVSRKGLRYKSLKPICITRKGKEKVVDNNHITIEEEVSEQGECETSCHHITIIEETKIKTPEEDVEDVLQSLEDGGQSTADLGTTEEPRPTFIIHLSLVKRKVSTCFLIEYRDIFAWSYKEMSGLDPKVAVYHLSIKHGYRSIKQAQGLFDQSLFPKSRMTLSDEEMKAFRTPKGIYCYKLMPFGLKNVGPTYQCAIQKEFSDMLHKSLGALLAQKEEKGKERALDYSSRTLVGVQVNCFSIQKMCLALFFAIDKLRHYMQGLHSSSSKGRPYKLCEDLPDDEVFFTEAMEPWTMYFNGTARRSGVEASIIFISPEKNMLPYSFALAELCLNNVAKYQALIIGLQMTLEIAPYFTYARQLMERFDSVMLERVSRTENKRADALANLATTLTMLEDITLNIPLCQRWIMPLIMSKCQEANVMISHLIDEEDWRQPIIEYLEHGKLPKDSCHKNEKKSIKSLKEAHVGVCGTHQSGPKLQLQLRIMGYYWPKMVQDSMDYAKKCKVCQYHVNFIHQPLEPLYPTMASWPFEAWGLDLVDPIAPKSLAVSLQQQIISQRVTLYSLVYGVEVVLPLKREIPSLRMTVQERLTTEDNVKLHLQELEALDEK